VPAPPGIEPPPVIEPPPAIVDPAPGRAGTATEDGLPAPGAKAGAKAARSSVGVILFGKRAGSHWIDPDQALTRTADRASRDPDLVVEIDGFADHRGGKRDGKKLGLRRARQVALELQSAGVAPDRMILRGHVANRGRGRGRSAFKSNRRVEIRMHTRGR
jgi:outer membrane protein OmpA-like peptidoglycan-associated protein